MDTQKITEEAIRNLSKLNEFKVDGEHYTIQEIFPVDQIEKETRELKEWDWNFREGEVVIGSDPNGNQYTAYKESVWFWDHETDERKELSKSRLDFYTSLREPEEIDINFDPKKDEVEVWTKPGFENFKPEWD